jgi:hypothetical protein
VELQVDTNILEEYTAQSSALCSTTCDVFWPVIKKEVFECKTEDTVIFMWKSDSLFAMCYYIIPRFCAPLYTLVDG